MILGVVAKCKKKRKHVIRRWRLDIFLNDEKKLCYKSALKAEVGGFRESIKINVNLEDLRRNDLVNVVLGKWKDIVLELKGRLGKR